MTTPVCRMIQKDSDLNTGLINCCHYVSSGTETSSMPQLLALVDRMTRSTCLNFCIDVMLAFTALIMFFAF